MQQHTFGGSALDRRLVEFEAIDDAPASSGPSEFDVATAFAERPDSAATAEASTEAPVAEVGDEGGAVPSPAPSAAETEGLVAEPSGETAAPPPFDLNNPEVALEIQRIAGEQAEQQLEARLNALIEEAQQYEQPQYAQQQAVLPPDPLSDNYSEEFAAYMAYERQQMMAGFREVIAPLTQREAARDQEAGRAEAAERIKDIFSDLTSRLGELGDLGGQNATDVVRSLADSILPGLKAQYGGGPKVAELALERAYKQVQGIVSAAEKRGAEKYQNQSNTIADAATEPGVSTVGAPALDDEEAVYRKYGLDPALMR